MTFNKVSLHLFEHKTRTVLFYLQSALDSFYHFEPIILGRNFDKFVMKENATYLLFSLR